jgi:predicted nucleic acid-binding protein
MIVYLDTSSLVKLYIEEEGSPQIATLLESSDVTATSIVAYAEARAAFARRYREKAFSPRDYDRLKAIFEEDWRNYLVLHISGDIIKLAGNLAEKHALRGFDAIHLASALNLRNELATSIVFSCFDDNLLKASETEGFTLG